MRLLSARVVVPLAAVVVAWGAAHLLASRATVAVQPAVWPATATPASAGSPVWPPAASSVPAPAPSGSTPFLPGVMEQLNGDTRDTALGLYALITQLEESLSGHLRSLAQQLEPGR